MIISIHQPQYLPWLGYFDKIDRCDKFVLLDDVQFKKNEWQNRNRIKTAQGACWITVPVLHNFGQKINEVCADSRVDWCRKHLHSIETNYSRAAHFKRYSGLFTDAYSRKWEGLCDVNVFFIEGLVKALGIDTPMVKSSGLNTAGGKTDRLISICRELSADTYLSGEGARDYIELDKFEKEGIKVVFQGFRHPSYPQLCGDFLSHLSVADLLFNCGPDSLNIIRSREPEE